MARLITLDLKTFSYADKSVLHGSALSYSAGEFALVAGSTGSGKSTLLRLLNGLAPHFTGGIFTGSVAIDGRDLTGTEPHGFAHLVGYVNQLAEASFVADTVREELAFGMEQLGTPPEEMNSRISKVAKTLELSHLLDTPLDQLSGGYQQRVAIAAALAAGQQILLLDEPTSELDEWSATSLLNLLQGLAHNGGITVIIAEHRVDRLLKMVDSLTVVSHGQAVKHTDTTQFAEIAETASLLPTLVRPNLVPVANEQPALEAINVSVQFGKIPALAGINFRAPRGSITGVFGANGSGKSSLLWALQGSLPYAGSIIIHADAAGSIMQTPRSKGKVRQLAMVPQTATDLLVLHSVAEELTEADAFAEVATGTAQGLFEALIGSVDLKMHPRDLSSGQQLALALAIQLVKGSQVLLLDEPTRGLDYAARDELSRQLCMLAGTGHTIVVASHDRDFLLRTTSSCLWLESGLVRAFGPTEVVLA